MHAPSPIPPNVTKLFVAESLREAMPQLEHGFTAGLPFADGQGFAAAFGAATADTIPPLAGPLVLLGQPHGGRITDAAKTTPPAPANDGGPPPGLDSYDGATATVAAPALLTVRAADCVPILAVAPELGAYAALHAGWRGIAAGILPRLLEQWRSAGGDSVQVRLAFGPAIGPCCYEVGPDCLAAFAPDLLAGAVVRRGNATMLHLTALLTTQAQAHGVRAEQIEVLPYCTYCHQTRDGGHPFASYRRARAEERPTEGRNAAFIGMARRA